MFNQRTIIATVNPLAAAVLGVIALSGAATAGVFEVEVFRSGTEGYNVFRIPTIVSAANGDLVLFSAPHFAIPHLAVGAE